MDLIIGGLIIIGLLIYGAVITKYDCCDKDKE